MNRSTVVNTHTFEKKVTKVYATVAVGAAGAPTLQAFKGPGNNMALAAAGTPGFNGVKSIARVDTGKYKVTLQDRHVRLLSFRAEFRADNAPAAPNAHVQATGTDLTKNEVTFICRQLSDGAATDPANGEVMSLTLEFLDSTAP